MKFRNNKNPPLSPALMLLSENIGFIEYRDLGAENVRYPTHKLQLFENESSVFTLK